MNDITPLSLVPTAPDPAAAIDGVFARLAPPPTPTELKAIIAQQRVRRAQWQMEQAAKPARKRKAATT
jgi:hypothetical protein